MNRTERLRLMLAPLALILALLPGCAAHRAASPAASTEAARQELERREAGFFAAVAARDADAVAGFFAEDAVLHVANMPPVRGRAAIHPFYRNMFGFMMGSSAVPETLHVAEAGDMAYGVGRSVNRFGGPDGPVEFVGKYVVVWRRLDGEWRVVLYGVSNDQAEARGG